MSKQVSKGLGTGFGSLLPQDFDQSLLLEKHDRVQRVAIEDIEADPDQPRRQFDETAINELAQSIKRYGILQPLVVTEHNGHYRIVAGERRFRAAKKAKLSNVPVLVRTLEELERLEISLVENVQRVDLNPVEQAVSIVKLHEQFNVGYPEIAQRLGKAHSTVANIVRLLQLPEFAREALSSGRISEGHARALLALKDEKLQKELLDNIEQYGWSVRAAEQFVSENRIQKNDSADKIKPPKTVVDTILSKKLSTTLGFNVRVKQKVDGGSLAITFKDRNQMENFLKFLQQNAKSLDD